MCNEYWKTPEFQNIVDAVQAFTASENEVGESFFTTDFVLVLHMVDMNKPDNGESHYLTLSTGRPAHVAEGLLQIGKNYYQDLGSSGCEHE